MERPTVSLHMIVKNEEQNMPRLFKSVEGCFDEIVIVDTGSTDNTVKVCEDHGAKIYHFEWINDFAAARNFALSKVTSDFAFFMDADDILFNKDAFIDFRDNSLKYFDYVLATYHYAVDKDQNPVISFARERIMRMSMGPKWQYFVHEGVPPMPGARIHYCTNWSVKHLRSEEDMKKDKSRNLMIFEEKKKSGQLDGRLTFYYGKELFENAQADKAIPVLLESVAMPIEPHDRILALQYACYAIQQETEKLKPEHQGEKLQQAINLATQALMLAPNRAEFHSIIGDCNLKLGRLAEALPSFGAAKYCLGVPQAGDAFAGPIHSFKPLYQDYPRIQIAKILFHLGRVEDAKKEAKECFELFGNQEAKTLYDELVKLSPLTTIEGDKVKTSDIVFTCPPQTAYEFDEELYKTKGMGGSETALIEMAKWLKKLTQRRVIVFNMRSQSMTSESGVEYHSTDKIPEYFAKYEPAAHIAWRHNIRVTKAPSYLWCHDLMIPGVENGLNQDFVLALSPFHRDFLASSQGVSRGKIILTRNGIAPEKFEGLDTKTKDPLLFVYPSSPDRGLDRCMLILDKVRAKGYDVKLNVYYGLENLYKYGQAELAEKLKQMMAERPWVNYRGLVEQKQMYKEFANAAMAMMPNNFIETSMITALELVACGVYIVIRKWGGVANTLERSERLKMCTMLDIDSATDDQHETYAKEVVKALEEKAWERVSLPLAEHAWSKVAVDWINLMSLHDGGQVEKTMETLSGPSRLEGNAERSEASI